MIEDAQVFLIYSREIALVLAQGIKKGVKKLLSLFSTTFNLTIYDFLLRLILRLTSFVRIKVLRHLSHFALVLL